MVSVGQPSQAWRLPKEVQQHNALVEAKRQEKLAKRKARRGE